MTHATHAPGASPHIHLFVFQTHLVREHGPPQRRDDRRERKRAEG
jgi:hypothetical protein